MEKPACLDVPESILPKGVYGPDEGPEDGWLEQSVLDTSNSPAQ